MLAWTCGSQMCSTSRNNDTNANPRHHHFILILHGKGLCPTHRYLMHAIKQPGIACRSRLSEKIQTQLQQLQSRARMHAQRRTHTYINTYTHICIHMACSRTKTKALTDHYHMEMVRGSSLAYGDGEGIKLIMWRW